MAKEIQTRLPRPQKQVTQTYARPNPRGPDWPGRLAPPLPYDPSFERAGARLANSLARWGLVEQKREYDLIEQQEEIRIAKMDSEELEVELKKLALEAEQLNTWAISSNPFRIKVAMENAADRIMRGSYAAALEKQTSRFADPLNPDSEQEAAQFAADTFRELPIQGPWAQARASEMYDDMTSTWLANVRGKKRQRLEAKAHEDVSDITYRALTDFLDEPIKTPWADALARIDEAANEGRSITGLSMRDDIVAGMKQVYTQRANAAVNEGDIEDIEALLSSLDTIEAINEGPMALSEEQAAELGDIRTFLDNAIERAGEKDRIEIERDEASADDIANAWIVEHSQAGEPLPVDLADPSVVALQQEMRDAELSETAINNYFANTFRGRVNAHVSGGGRPNQQILDATRVALRDIDDHEPRRAYIYAQDLPVQTQEVLVDESRKRRDSDARAAAFLLIGPDGSARDSLIKSEASTAAATKLAKDKVDPADLDSLTDLEVDINRWVQEGGREAAKKDYATSAERHEAIDAAIAARDALISKVRKDGGLDYNIELAAQEGIPAHIIEGMATVSRGAAEAELRGQRLKIEERDVDAEGAALFGGYWWHRAIFDYADNIHQNWTETLAKPGATALSRSKAASEVNKLTAAMVTDAAKLIEEKQKIHQSGGIDPSSLGTRGERITPKGVLVYTRPGTFSTGKYWEEDVEATNDYLQAIRILGLTPDQMKSGDVSGIGVEHFDELKDPMRTGMIPVDSFEADLAQVANTNTPDMTQEELLGKLKGNGIAEGYNAYVEMVGVNDAVGFDAFLNMQINGIGRYRLPVPEASLLKQLEIGTTQ